MASHQLRLRREQQTQRDRQRQHSLAYRHMRDDVVDQVRSGLSVRASSESAKPSALAVLRFWKVSFQTVPAVKRTAYKSGFGFVSTCETVGSMPGSQGIRLHAVRPCPDDTSNPHPRGR